MKRAKKTMKKEDGEGYYCNPPSTKTGKRRTSSISVRREEEDSSEKYESSSAGESTIHNRVISQAEADAIYKQLTSECESQVALKMYISILRINLC